MLFIQPVQPVSFSLYQPASVYTGYAQAPAAAMLLLFQLITASLFIPVRKGSTQSASHLQEDWLAMLVLRLQKAPDSVLSLCLLHIYPWHYCRTHPCSWSWLQGILLLPMKAVLVILIPGNTSQRPPVHPRHAAIRDWPGTLLVICL